MMRTLFLVIGLSVMSSLAWANVTTDCYAIGNTLHCDSTDWDAAHRQWQATNPNPTLDDVRFGRHPYLGEGHVTDDDREQADERPWSDHY